MTGVFRGSPEAEARRRSREREIADGLAGADRPLRLSAAQVKDVCLGLGADDVGFVEVERAALGNQRDAARRLLPGVQTLLSLVVATNRDNLASPPRSVANEGFHHDGEHLASVAHGVARELRRLGAGVVVTSVGLGHMGINRNEIHRRDPCRAVEQHRDEGGLLAVHHAGRCVDVAVPAGHPSG